MRSRRVDVEEQGATHERRSKTPAEAMQSLMRLCARAEKSSGDALRLMRTWGVAESERRGVLEQLIAQRYIDDKRYAEAYVREKTQLSGWGARKIAMQLRQKGVAQEIIRNALGALDADNMEERLYERLARKSRNVKAANSYELRGKLLRYGLSLGYEYDMCIGVIDKIVAAE